MAKGNHPLLVFIPAGDKTDGHIHIGELQTDKLRHTDPCRIKKLQHRLVADLLRIRAGRLLQKLCHLIHRQDHRHFLFNLRRMDRIRRIPPDLSFPEHPAEKGFRRCQKS